MMKIKFLHLFLSVFLIGNTFSCSDSKGGGDPLEPDAKGLTAKWTFDNKDNLLVATIGANMTLAGTHKAVAGPSAANGAMEISKGSYLKAAHGVKPNGGGQKVNDYTLVFDISYPSDDWKSLFSTHLLNNADGECYISPKGELGLGVTGYSDALLTKNEWYKVVLSVKVNGSIDYYVDGELVLRGATQTLDGNYALASELLFFADNDGEDGTIRVAEISVWDHALTAQEIKALGGYGHTIPNIDRIAPYLQQPDDKSAVVSWEDSSADALEVEYGTDANLGKKQASKGITVAKGLYWQTAKLVDLTPNTVYYYQVKGKKGTSDVYTFRTLPANDQVKKIRFLLTGDTQDNPDITSNVIAKAKAKMEQLYGADLHNQINFVMHTGDLLQYADQVGNYRKEYFKPMAQLSANTPFLVTSGNHEREDVYNYFYQFMYADDISGAPVGNANFERYWSKRIGNTLLVGLNSTYSPLRQAQKDWLSKVLTDADNDAGVDFVFCFIHETPFSEVWADERNIYITDQLIPVMQAHRKVQQLSYGHVHAYERGILESKAAGSLGDITLLADGGGGGTRDRWGAYENKDYPEINIALDHNFFVLCEIDVTNKSYRFDTYSLGNVDYPLNSVLVDSWERFVNKPAPSTPTAKSAALANNKFTLSASAYSGTMELFSAQYEVAEAADHAKVAVSEVRDVRNIYGVDASFKPVDKNFGIDLTQYTFDKSKLTDGTQYVWRVRYRDTNRKWSDWSAYTNLQ